MEHDSQPEAYCVHVWIRGIHPMLWRRFLVRSDSTLADLHAVLQIGFDWTDFHLHRFRIRKKDYAVPHRGGLGCHDARRIRELFDDLLEDIKTGNTEALDYRIEDLQPWQEWLMLHRFDRRRVNRRLRQYAEGASEWMSSRGGPQ